MEILIFALLVTGMLIGWCLHYLLASNKARPTYANCVVHISRQKDGRWYWHLRQKGMLIAIASIHRRWDTPYETMDAVKAVGNTLVDAVDKQDIKIERNDDATD